MSTKELGSFSNSDNNPCLTSCKPGACCKDKYFTYLSESEVSLLSLGKGRQLDSVYDLPNKDELKFKQPGVYYSQMKDKGRYFAVLVGKCLNLGESGECIIYEQRPVPCQRYSVGGEGCNNDRKREDLPPVSNFIQLSPRGSINSS